MEDLIVVRRYVEQFNPEAAHALAVKLVASAEALDHFPERGRPIRDGLRELLSVWPYILRYQVAADEIQILGIRHGSRRPD